MKNQRSFSTVDPWSQAQQAYRAGDLPRAQALLREFVEEQPHNAHAWHLLGVIASKQGHSAEAIRCLEHAAKLARKSPEIHAHLAEALRQAGQLEPALRAAERSVSLDPRQAAAHNNLGLILQDLHQPNEAKAAFQRAMKEDPRYPKAPYNLAALLHARKNWPETERLARLAVRLQHDYGQAHMLLGLALAEQHRHGEARESFAKAIALRPRDPKVHLNHGNALSKEKSTEEALRAYRQALALRPGYPEALLGQGGVYEQDKRLEQAAECYRQAIAAKPDWPEAHHRLGVVLFEQERDEPPAKTHPHPRPPLPSSGEGPGVRVSGVVEALAEIRRALELKPDFPEATCSLLRVLSSACDWTDLEENVALCRAQTREALVEHETPAIGPAQANAYDFTMPEKLEIARAHAAQIEARLTGTRERLGFRHPAPDSRPTRLRIGYFSYDLRNHATSHLMRTLFGLHDRRRFEIHTYSYGPDDQSDYRKKIAEDSDHFVDLKEATEEEMARRIHADGIHILVDLMGFVANCRPDVPALRPAPIQVNYLGFPGTMGARFMDYILTDGVVTPSGHVPYISEAIVRLPHTYQVTDGEQPIDPGPVTRSDERLPEHGFVFCCFNTLYKIEPRIFGVWMRILGQTPGSVLWMQARSPIARANLRKSAAGHGIDPDRIVFSEGKHKPLHLARFRLADLFLDTLYYNAHTTASDALWADVPVLTVPGEGFPSRVAASILTAAGLPELIQPDLGAYERTAVRLATEPGALQALKARWARLKPACPLFDTRRFARHVETAYETMWRRYAQGLPPAPFDVPA